MMQPANGYTLTNRLLGDPRPDREEYSAKVLAVTKFRAAKVEPGKYIPPHPAESRVMEVLSAISNGFRNAAAIAEQIGIGVNMASAYLKRARDRDLVVISEKVMIKSGGYTNIYALTDDGRKFLIDFGKGQ